MIPMVHAIFGGWPPPQLCKLCLGRGMGVYWYLLDHAFDFTKTLSYSLAISGLHLTHLCTFFNASILTRPSWPQTPVEGARSTTTVIIN